MIGRVLIGRYELTGLLSEGPLFAAYSARDRQTGRDVGIRLLQEPYRGQSLLPTALATAVERQRRIQSPTVETILRCETDGDATFLLADLTRSPSLGDRIRKLAPFSIAVAVGTAIGICRALDVVHQAGVVHGDLNPGNILVMGDGEIRLQMAGIWEAYAASPNAGMAVLPQMAPYLAPEVTRGSMPSVESDVYAVGVLLYELLTGRTPYRADSPIALANAHSMNPTPDVRDLNAGAPVVLAEIVRKAMSKDPAERYASAVDLMSDLRILQDAIRFGKTLTWPLRPTEVAAKSSPRAKASGPKELQPVAPRMSALRSDDDAEEARRRAREDRDVPVWMWVIASIGAIAVLITVGLYFATNLSKPKIVTAPNIVDMSLSEAQSAVKTLKLEVKVRSRQFSEKVEQDKILQQDPEAGEKIREGERIRVILSSGTKMVEVPDLTGLTVDKAKQLLGKLNLEAMEQVVGGGDPRPDSVVLRSDPPARTKVDRFGRIIVVIGDRSRIEDKKPAADDRLANFTYRLHLDKIEQETNVRIDMTDDMGTKTVFESAKQPGEDVEVTMKGKGARVTIQVYFDGQLTKTEVVEPDR